jgi:hypothetical protein
MDATSGCFKVCYQSRKQAKKALKEQNTTKKRFNLTDVYWCDKCRSYHLTSMGKQRSRDLKRHINNKKK